MRKLSEETSKFLLLLWQPPALITASQPWGVCPSLSKELPWLPIKFCCQYKVAILACHHFNSQQQPSISTSLSTYRMSHTLWSSKKKLQKVRLKNIFLTQIWNFWSTLFYKFSVSSLQLSGICCLPVCNISPFWIQNPAQDLFRKVFSISQTQLNHSASIEHMCVCMCVYYIVYLIICVSVVCGTTLSFCSVKMNSQCC